MKMLRMLQYVMNRDGSSSSSSRTRISSSVISNSSSNSGSFYSVLGVEKSSSGSEIKAAYRKLAMKWHPDKCASPGDYELARTKFQDVQSAYAVLSDDNKRFLYDCGLYNEQDDEGMQSFMGEMANMMSDSSKSSFEELQDMFKDMVDSYSSPSQVSSNFWEDSAQVFSSLCSSSSSSCSEAQPSLFSDCLNQGFCIGKEDPETFPKQKLQKKVPRRRKCGPVERGNV